MKNILMVVGSFRRQSLNKQLAHMIEQTIGDRAKVSYLSFSDLPCMNQDKEVPAPLEVTRVREAVAAADGLWIVSPEYNASYPGAVKNLIDWLSRPIVPNDYATPLPIWGMPVTISTAAGGLKGAGMVAKLTDLLKFVRFAKPTEPFCQVNYGRVALVTNILELDDADRELLSQQVDAFLKAIE